MIFLILSVGIPVLIWVFFPIFIQFVGGKTIRRNSTLALACFLYFISWRLPSPLIHGVDTSFTTHLIGGGVFCGMLWLFIKQQLNIQLSWIVELITLYGFVSAFGVANELFELATVEFHLTKLTGADTWWDLLANTLGALLFWAVYRLSIKIKRPNFRELDSKGKN